MTKRKLKPFVLPMIYGILCATIVMTLVLIDKQNTQSVMSEKDEYIYVNNSILTNDIPVVSEETSIIKPYLSDKVQISKKFYDLNASEEEKKTAIIFYNDTYVQNSGILYKCEESFDVVSILDGTVVDVKKDEILGNVVEIKHSNNIISTYEGLSTVNVKKDSTIKQGDVIGKSGKIDVGESIENGLLFEIIYDGKYANPEKYFDKKISEL